MEKMFRVPLKFGGYKYFIGENAESEANAYEVEMKQREIEEKERQKKEQEERAARVAKAEEERKKKEEAIEVCYCKVLDKVDAVNNVVEDYEKVAGERLEFVTVNGKLNARKHSGLDSYPQVNITSNGIWLHDLIKKMNQINRLG